MMDFVHKSKRFKQKIFTRLFGAITNVHTVKPVVALTFDDGPDPVDTPKILDLLGHYGVKATFFVLGIRAAKQPELIQRIFNDGHVLGNHGWSHASMPALSSSQRRQELKKSWKVLKPYGTRLFRPPFGHLDWPTIRDLSYFRYRLVLWNIAAYDWLDHSDQEIITSIESKLTPGSIILLHDSLYTFERVEYRNREPLLSTLEQFFEKMRGQYSFVTIPELLEMGRANKIHRVTKVDQAFLRKQLSMNKMG